MNNAIQCAFTDKFGTEHADAVHVLELVNVNRINRSATAVYGSYHSADARLAGKDAIDIHTVVATSIDSLSVNSFDELIAAVVAIGLAADPFFSGGVAIEVPAVETIQD